jgi:hypothetical protein
MQGATTAGSKTKIPTPPPSWLKRPGSPMITIERFERIKMMTFKEYLRQLIMINGFHSLIN